MMSPILQPRLLAFRGYLRKLPFQPTLVIRDGIIILLAFGVARALYALTTFAISRVLENSELVYLSPSSPLSIIFLFLFAMLLISNTMSAISALYMAEDSDLILASPISRESFYLGKLLLIFLSSSWMPIVFLLPVLVGFADKWGAGGAFFIVALPLLLLYFLIPACLAIFIATILLAFIPLQRTRALRFLGFILVVVFLGSVAHLFRVASSSNGDLSGLFRALSILSLPSSLWLPSHWIAYALGEMLEQRSLNLPAVGLLVSVFLSTLVFSYATFGILFERARLKATVHAVRPARKRGRDILEWCCRLIPLAQTSRAICKKDIRQFSRDLSQVAQLILLGVIYCIYLYNIQIFRLIDNMPINRQYTLSALVFIANSCMAAFVATAASNRLVFPALSLEGKGIWILQASPLSMQEVVTGKFRTWLFPIGVLTSIVMTLGGSLLSLPPVALVGLFVCSWFMTYGIVGLGIGLGAYFAQFEWEHSAQLIASLGSFVFMLASVSLISVSVAPLGVVIFSSLPAAMGERLSTTENWILALSAAATIFIINYQVKQLVIEVGLQKLSGRIR